jgi:hypothetical protein
VRGLRLLCLGIAVQITPAMAAGDCDLVWRWDNREIDACIKELKSEIFILKLQLQTEAAENKMMRNNLCLLATELKTTNAADIAELACS